MNNTTELTAELKEIFAKVKDGKIGLKEAKVLVATARTMIKANAVQMEYAKFQGTKNVIPFLVTPPEKK
jgi:hypothetical protein